MAATTHRSKGLGSIDASPSVFRVLGEEKERSRPSRSSSSAVSSLKTVEDPANWTGGGDDDHDVHHEGADVVGEDLEPTEVDMTETEQNEESNSFLLYDDRAVIFPHKQSLIREVVSDINTAPESKEEGEDKYGEDDHDDDDDDVELFTMEMLIGMLSDANHPDAYSRRRHPKQPNRGLRLEDLTEILSHVNMCEAIDTDPRWDVIHELAYGIRDGTAPVPRRKRREQRREQQQQQSEEEIEDGMIILDARSSGSSRLEKLKYEQANEDDTDRHRPPRTPERKLPQRTKSSDSQSLSLGDLMGDTKDSLDGDDDAGVDSVFTLEAHTHSVQSSVTWFEGADITEIEISEADLEEFLPSYRHGSNGDYDDDDDDDDDGESTAGDSTPPPPPSQTAILYTPPPPMDGGLSLGEEDSLSRCYRRRHPRRYAESE